MVLVNTESCRYWTWSKESLLQWQNNISRQVGRCSCIVGSKTIQCVLPNSYCNCFREGKKHANKRKLVTTLQTTHAHSFQLSYKGRKRSPSTTSDWTTTNINLKLSINMDSSTNAESRRQERCTALAGDRSSFAYHAVTFVSAFLPSSVWIY